MTEGDVMAAADTNHWLYSHSPYICR